MAESSDPLLLSKKSQKLVKGSDGLPGILLITQTKIKWQPDDPSSANPISIDISSISRQQQAPGKPFLRILHPGEPLGLSFPSEADKDEVIEFLKQLKPPTQPSSHPRDSNIPSPAQKQHLFAKDKDLEALYGQLVTQGILTESEFWKEKANAITKLTDTHFNGASTSLKKKRHQQQSGLSSVMHEVERMHDGHSERISIHLTPKDIENIFIEHPEVHRAFLAHVPHSLSEQEFWQQYFKSEYKKAARRKRYATAGHHLINTDEDFENDDDIFAVFRRQLAEQQQKEAKRRMKLVDPTVNVAATVADGFSGGFGLVHGGGDALGTSLRQNDGGEGAINRSTLGSLVRDVNRHAAHVLEGALEGLSIAPQDQNSDLQKLTESKEGGGGIDDDDIEGGAHKRKEKQIKEEGAISIAARIAAAQQSKIMAMVSRGDTKIAPGQQHQHHNQMEPSVYEESENEELMEEWKVRAASALDDLSLEKIEDVVPLTIKNPRIYFDTTTGTGTGIAGTKSHPPTSSLVPGESKKKVEESGIYDIEMATTRQPLGTKRKEELISEIQSIDPGSLDDPPCRADTAFRALIEISRDQNQELIREFGPIAASIVNVHPKNALGSVMVEFFRTEALVVNELLRHLWGCFPLLSEQRKAKALKLTTHIEKQKTALTAHMSTQQGTAQQVYIVQIVEPLVEAIHTGLEKYNEELMAAKRM